MPDAYAAGRVARLCRHEPCDRGEEVGPPDFDRADAIVEIIMRALKP